MSTISNFQLFQTLYIMFMYYMYHIIYNLLDYIIINIYIYHQSH